MNNIERYNQIFIGTFDIMTDDIINSYEPSMKRVTEKN